MQAVKDNNDDVNRENGNRRQIAQQNARGRKRRNKRLRSGEEGGGRVFEESCLPHGMGDQGNLRWSTLIVATKEMNKKLDAFARQPFWTDCPPLV